MSRKNVYLPMVSTQSMQNDQVTSLLMYVSNYDILFLKAVRKSYLNLALNGKLLWLKKSIIVLDLLETYLKQQLDI